MKSIRLPLKAVLLVLALLLASVLLSLSAIADDSKNSSGKSKNNKQIDYFELSLEELLDIKVEISAATETRQQFIPSSTTIITQGQIQLSGGRTLNDVLNLYVPGYFKAEDKDDTIAGFRGFAPDNNSKVLLLIDGIRVNADWFWGPADNILNGIGLDYVERIEVIRGPGSVLLGQGALLGVINVITKTTERRSQVKVSLGEQNHHSISGATSSIFNGVKYEFFGSNTKLDGFALPHLGWAAEVHESDSAHPAAPALRGNRLNRSESLRLMAKASEFDWNIWLQHHQQKRDLYNWSKDRDEVEQRLTIIAADYYYPLSNDLTVKIQGNWQQDDYALYDHTSGLITGGAREQRAFAQARLYSKFSEIGVSWLVAAEVEQIKSGLENWQGDNFIVNNINNLTGDLNQTNTWVYNNTSFNKAIIGELNAIWDNNWKLNLGLRNDYHAHWGKHFTPRASVTYQSDESSNVYRFTYQRGFKGAPGVHYIGGFRGDGLVSDQNLTYIGDTSMTSASDGSPVTSPVSPHPETMTSMEFAIKGVVDKYLSFEAILYQNQIDNFIVTLSTRNGTAGELIGSDPTGDWGGVFYYTNENGEITLRGAELSAIWQKNSWQQSLSFSTHDIVSSSGFDFGMNSPLAGSKADPHSNGIPESIWRYQTIWRPSSNLNMSYQHILYQSWWAPWTNTKESGMNWGNVSAVYSYNENLSFKFLINNVWNEKGLYPIRARGNGNVTPGTPSLEPRNVNVSMTYRF